MSNESAPALNSRSRVPSAQKAPCTRRLCGWRYRIRHLFLAVTLVGLVLGPVVSLERSVRREEAATKVVAAYDGYDGKAISRDVWPQWVPRRYRGAVARVDIVGEPRRRSNA